MSVCGTGGLPQWMCNTSSTTTAGVGPWTHMVRAWQGIGSCRLLQAWGLWLCHRYTCRLVLEIRGRMAWWGAEMILELQNFSQNVYPSCGRVWIASCPVPTQVKRQLLLSIEIQRRDCHHSTKSCPRHGLSLLRGYRVLKSCWSGFSYSDQCQPASRQLKLSFAIHYEWQVTPFSSMRCVFLHANAAFTLYENDHQNTTWQLFIDLNS